MALLSSKFMRTLQLVLDAAVNFRRRRVNGDELVGRQGYPPRYYEPILNALVKAGILKGARGPNGGYHFSADPEDITLADIEHVVSSTSIKKAEDTGEPIPMRTMVTGPLFSEIAKRWTRHLSAITIADLCRKAMRLSGGRDLPVGTMQTADRTIPYADAQPYEEAEMPPPTS
ncbi:MAG: Rrf2 family transcriptional regulator [Rhodospirillales bacterium]|nr:Rrf2 family transcriptional regulator [Rhodospirillales bacterium]